MASSSASAESVGSSTLSVRVKDVIAIRILDDTGTSSISTLGIDIAPTPNGSTVTKNAIVDVATSNETGYTLYMDSDYKEDGTSSSTTPETQFNYTTDLIHTDPTVTVTIPSSVPSSSSDTNFWNYTTSWNDTIGTGSNTTTLTGSTPATVIPTHGTPDTIRDDVTEPSDSSMTTIGINVNVNNDIPSGTYKNKLVFTAVANELPPATPAFWNITTMQEMTPEVCASVYTPTNAVSMTDANIITLERYQNGDYDSVTSDNSSPLVPERTLIDDRDADGTGTKKSYKVRKLADGNCWMVDNLEYDLLALYNNGKRGIGSKNDGSTFEMTDANLASSVGYYTTTADAYDYVVNPNTKSISNATVNSYLGNATRPEYYYNWTAATAGQGSRNNTGGAVDGSICPAGWRLPTNYTDLANQSISWSALTNAYLSIVDYASTNIGYQTLEQYPINLYRTGHVGSGGQGYTTYGYYWSSSANSNIYGYHLRYTTGEVRSQFNNPKYYGFSVRCVANSAPPKTLWQISTMQEMTPAVCATTTTPTSSATSLDTDGTHIGDTSYVPQNTLTDTRDNNTYIVRKLADGNCWMSQNLKTNLNTTTFTNENTNITTTSWTPDSSALQNHVIHPDWGGYYSQAAVTANGNGSICPKGWTAPPYQGTYSYYNLLYTTYSANTIAKFNAVPLSFTQSGLYDNNNYGVLGQDGNYRTANDTIVSYSAGGIYYGNGQWPTTRGYAFRCVANPNYL